MKMIAVSDPQAASILTDLSLLSQRYQRLIARLEDELAVEKTPLRVPNPMTVAQTSVEMTIAAAQIQQQVTVADSAGLHEHVYVALEGTAMFIAA